MNTDLERRLRDLAAEAPPSLSADGLWERGVRRRRTQRLAAVAGSVAVLVALAGGVQAGSSLLNDDALPAAPVTGIGHLPRTIEVPAAWSEGTSEAGELGVLAAVGSSDRKRPKGVLGMVAYESLYGVSAVDGSVRFLDIPAQTENRDMPGQVFNVALSPDGKKVAFARFDGTQNTSFFGAVTGWSVYDSVTGEVVRLTDPAVPRTNADDLDFAFSADSRYLLTTYAAEGVTDNTKDEFVAWNLEDGTRAIVEGPGEYWQPNVGSGPGGIVWSRDNTTHTFDPTSRETTSIRTEHDPVSASYAPSGSAFAYVGGELTRDGINAPWRLYVGPHPERMRPVPGIEDAGFVLGWRDPDHVVVATTDRDYVVVDVNDRSVERGRFGGSVNLNVPMLASDLWAHDRVAGVDPADASDPRTQARVAGLLGGLVLAAGVFGTVRWRRRRG